MVLQHLLLAAASGKGATDEVEATRDARWYRAIVLEGTNQQLVLNFPLLEVGVVGFNLGRPPGLEP